MAEENNVIVPDIGGATDVDVIEILVKAGDEIGVDTSLITLESDKASMEIPSPKAGKVKSIHLKVGDKVSEGDLILTLEGEAKGSSTAKKSAPIEEEKKENTPAPEPQKAAEKKQQGSTLQKITIPDIGGATDVDVIDILVKKGEQVSKDQSLITLEGDKATMDIPSPAAGVVDSISMKLGDKVSQGDLILMLKVEEGSFETEEPAPVQSEPAQPAAEKEATVRTVVEERPQPMDSADNGSLIFAGPAVRRLAREFGVNLALVKGTGRKSRIMKEDVQNYVKTKLSEKEGPGGLAIPAAPKIDFSKFGEIEVKALNKIKKLTGVNVHRSWLTIPHVTQFDEADITDLEAFRKSEQEAAKKEGYKLTILAFVTKIVANALLQFPQFNSSLDEKGEQLIYKKYVNIGIAVETENGLVVPVIKGVDKLSVSEIAKEMGRLSQKAREKGLMPADMSGGCFTISSLGGIGGTAFTPIVNSPEVAILGLSRSDFKPVYENGAFVPRLMLPLSLSYDHRVIDGAEAARFSRYIAVALGEIRKIIL